MVPSGLEYRYFREEDLMLPRGTEYTIRCADLGDPNCDWETSADSKEELLRRVKEHGREKHEWTQEVRQQQGFDRAGLQLPQERIPD